MQRHIFTVVFVTGDKKKKTKKKSLSAIVQNMYSGQ